MKSLSLTVLAAASFAALALSGCKEGIPGCKPEAATEEAAAPTVQAVRCPPGNAVSGNRCVPPNKP